MRPTRDRLADVLPAAPSAVPMLPPVEWAALPLAARVADRLAEMLIAASEVRAALERKEAAPLAGADLGKDTFTDVLTRVERFRKVRPGQTTQRG